MGALIWLAIGLLLFGVFGFFGIFFRLSATILYIVFIAAIVMFIANFFMGRKRRMTK
jgi:uncharacterized membrane protein YtjA (UPF0391 family)